MVGLVFLVLVVMVVAHQLFFEREVRGDGRQRLAEIVQFRVRPVLLLDLELETVDQLDQLAMLVIDRRDADREPVIPFDQSHARTYCPARSPSKPNPLRAV